MGEIVDADPGRERALAAGAAAAGPKLNFATTGFGFLSMIRVSDLRRSLSSGGTRTVIGTTAASSAVTGASSVTLPSSALMSRSPKVICFSAGQTSSSARATEATQTRSFRQAPPQRTQRQGDQQGWTRLNPPEH